MATRIGGLAMVLVVSFLVGNSTLAGEVHNAVYGGGDQVLAIATGCPGEYGLLAAWAEPFGSREQVAIHWRKAGPEKALRLLQSRKVDLALLHHPSAEARALAEGWAVGGTVLCVNEFVLAGPSEDPAQVRSAPTVAAALRRIAAAEARFYSRGDNAWAHKLERALWREAEVEPRGAWYQVTGTCTTEILDEVVRKPGYFLINSSAFSAHRHETGTVLSVLLRDPSRLTNYFRALHRPGVGDGAAASDLAARFVDFALSPEGQRIVASLGKGRFGSALFTPALEAVEAGGE